MTDTDTEAQQYERAPDTPSEWTYHHYREAVETSRDAALEALAEYPLDYDDLYAAVDYAIQGDRLVHNYGWMLMTVLLSDQDPEHPDYGERWSANVDWSGVPDDPPTWSECVEAMARACYYSDVFDAVTRSPPGLDWTRTGPTEFKNNDAGMMVEAEEQREGTFRLYGVAGPLGGETFDTLADALGAATDWIADHPEGDA